MDGTELAALITVCITGGAMVHSFFGIFRHRHLSARQAAEQRASLAEERAQQQELRLADLTRQNEQLQKQLEWHARLLETQDQLLKQLGNGSAAKRALEDSTKLVS
ncbi:MAG TPA: hypothetical protein VHS99_15605 [Chloroflexota bacterium]|nr:hypothetical protein [Chloroflexota bacterium]